MLDGQFFYGVGFFRNECVGKCFLSLENQVCHEKKMCRAVMNNFKGVIMSNVRNGVCMPACLFIVKKHQGVICLTTSRFLRRFMRIIVTQITKAPAYHLSPAASSRLVPSGVFHPKKLNSDRVDFQPISKNEIPNTFVLLYLVTFSGTFCLAHVEQYSNQFYLMVTNQHTMRNKLSYHG